MHICMQLTSGWSHCHLQISGFTRVSRQILFKAGWCSSLIICHSHYLQSMVKPLLVHEWLLAVTRWNLHWRCQHVCKHSMQTTSNLVGSKATTRSFLVQRHISPSNQFHSNHSPTGWGIHFVPSKLRFPRCAWVITLLCSNMHLLPLIPTRTTNNIY